MINYITTSKVEIDIHNMKCAEAKKFLEQFLSKANGNVKEVTVIHGYSSGTVLQRMVRVNLKHYRIKHKMLTLNPGVTVLVLN
jgi:DNA-nicking Smr family endonuclease